MTSDPIPEIEATTVSASRSPIIVQAAVPIVNGDTPASLAERVLSEEHKIYPIALRLIAEGRTTVTGGRVIIDGAGAAKVWASDI